MDNNPKTLPHQNQRMEIWIYRHMEGILGTGEPAKGARSRLRLASLLLT